MNYANANCCVHALTALFAGIMHIFFIKQEFKLFFNKGIVLN